MAKENFTRKGSEPDHQPDEPCSLHKHQARAVSSDGGARSEPSQKIDFTHEGVEPDHQPDDSCFHIAKKMPRARGGCRFSSTARSEGHSGNQPGWMRERAKILQRACASIVALQKKGVSYERAYARVAKRLSRPSHAVQERSGRGERGSRFRMSNTRRSNSGEFNQERYCSAPEYEIGLRAYEVAKRSQLRECAQLRRDC